MYIYIVIIIIRLSIKIIHNSLNQSTRYAFYLLYLPINIIYLIFAFFQNCVIFNGNVKMKKKSFSMIYFKV